LKFLAPRIRHPAADVNPHFAQVDTQGAVSSLGMPLTQFRPRPSNTAPTPPMPGTRRSRRPMPRAPRPRVELLDAQSVAWLSVVCSARCRW
jgi:hypothetical protein